jgi:hypothetical protein
VQRLIVAIGTWFLFTAFFGSAGLIARGVLSRPHPSWSAVLEETLGEGDLLVVSTVLATDAVGRLVRSLFLNRLGLGNHPDLWTGFLGFAGCFVCFFFTVVMYVGAVTHRGALNTEISSVISDSLTWIWPTLAAAVAIVIAIEN